MLILFCSVACLHINGRFYNKLSQYQPETLVAGVCYSYDIEDNEKVDENSKEFLDFGNFIVYNVMILFIIHPIWSMTTKILVAFGCIVFIQVGYYSLGLLGKMWHVHILPGLPFPVITFFTINIDDINSFCGHMNQFMISSFSFNSNFECNRIKKSSCTYCLCLSIFFIRSQSKYFFVNYYITKKMSFKVDSNFVLMKLFQNLLKVTSIKLFVSLIIKHILSLIQK